MKHKGNDYLIIEGSMEIYTNLSEPGSPIVMVTIGNHNTVGQEIADFVGYKKTNLHSVIVQGKKIWRLTLEEIEKEGDVMT